MDEKHTPGPWVPNYQHVLDNNCNIVAAIKSAKWPHARAKADARLIAASPTVLAALQQLLEAYESHMHSEFDFPGDSWSAEGRGDEAALSARAAITLATGAA